MRVTLVWVGRTKNPHIRALCADYLERTRRLVPCQVVEVRDPGRARNLTGDELRRAEAAEIERALPARARLVALDAAGRQLGSDGLARWFGVERDRGVREIVFVIGGAEGLDETIRLKAHQMISLGRMTWTHELARVLLLEQIYRAFTILKGIPYHK